MKMNKTKNFSENLPAHTFKWESFSLAEGTRVLPGLQLVFSFVVNVLSLEVSKMSSGLLSIILYSSFGILNGLFALG